MSEPSLQRLRNASSEPCMDGPDRPNAPSATDASAASSFGWTEELTAALRLFQRHGVSARRHALSLAQEAAGRNDAVTRRHWEAVSRLLG